MFMTYSGLRADRVLMRLAVLASACFLSGAAPACAGAPALPPASPPFPTTADIAPPRAPEAASRPPEPASRLRADGTKPPRGRVCFNQAETRERIAAHRLTDPMRALRVGRQQGEALRARLCRWKPDEFIYEIYVLRRDGRVVRVYMNAGNGQLVGSLDDQIRK